jgi:hypothetical protein
MNPDVANEIRVLGGSVSDSVWSWMIRNGPHGPSFTWSQTKTEPPGYVGIEHLERIVDEKQAAEKDFKEKALKVVRSSLQSNNEEILVRAIQICAVVGTRDEIRNIGKLVDHGSELVSKNAKACSFYMKRKFR